MSFGPGIGDNYIENRESGYRIPMRESGSGSYLMDVEFSNGNRTSITVDSGAEESVCPWEWGEQFPVLKKGPLRGFRSASGGEIHHHGSREVVVRSPF